MKSILDDDTELLLGYLKEVAGLVLEEGDLVKQMSWGVWDLSRGTMHGFRCTTSENNLFRFSFTLFPKSDIPQNIKVTYKGIERKFGFLEESGGETETRFYEPKKKK